MSIAISVQYFDSLEYLQLAAVANANSVAVTFKFNAKQGSPIVLSHEQGTITHVAAAARFISQSGNGASSVEQHSTSAAQAAHLEQVLDTIEGQLHPLVSASLSGGAAGELPAVLAFLESALKATGTGQFSFGKQKGSLSIADIEAAILLSALPAASLQPYPLLAALLSSASASLTISTTLAANSIRTAKDIVKSTVHKALPLPHAGPAPAFPASSSSAKAESKSSEPRDIAWRPLIPDGHTPFTWFKPLPGQISHPFLQASAAPAPSAGPAAPAAQADGAAPATSGKKTKKKEERDAKLAAKKEAAAAKAQAKAAETDASAGEKKQKGRVKPKTNTQVVSEVIKKKVPHPIKTPSAATRNILITSALPYVNNVPHLGNLIGCVLSADVYSRFCRLRGYNCLYVCGTDEYGTATETKALDEKVTPKELCDKYHAIHRAIYEWFDIDFDHFGRTTTPQQTQIAQGIFWGCQKNKFVSEGKMDQLWCHTCDRFLSDRFVSGTCPKCGFGDARGDQCDGCGNLLNADELINAKCNRCKNPPEIRVSKHLFLDLDNDVLQGRLNNFIAQSSEKGKWTSNSVAITKAWINSGLKPRCITRDLKWGTPVPLDGYKDKVFYVWFDAPIGYISITANFTDQWEKWWKNPKDVELVQFMGKDNIPFHTVIFPSSLLATGEPWTLLHHVSTTEFLNYEQAKFSKSRGTGVFGDDAMRTGILPEIWRYYLMSTRPETNDSTFTWAEFQSRTNGELLANLGNFINRCLSFCKASFDGKVPAVGALTSSDKALIEAVQTELNNYIDDLENVRLRDGLRRVLTISSIGNAYQQEQKPWDLLKNGQTERCGTVVAIALNLVRLLGILAEPYMPATTLRVCEQLNIPREGLTLAGNPKFELVLPAGHEIGTPIPLFARIENEQVEELRKRFAGPEEKKEGPDFTLRLVSGVVTSVEDHPAAEHLYVLKVDTGVNGGGERSIVSGLKGHYSKEELKNKTVIVIANIKSANFKGVPSQGMVLTGQEGNTTGLLTVQGGKSLPPGTKIVPKGSNVVPSKNFNPKTEMKQQHLSVRKDGVVQFGSETHPLVVEGQDTFIVAEKVSPSAVIA